MDPIVELAKLFKERENRPYLGPQVGKVIAPPPDIKVSLGDYILLDKEDLVIGSLIQNSLVADDEVILIPSGDHQTYYLVDKAVRL